MKELKAVTDFNNTWCDATSENYNGLMNIGLNINKDTVCIKSALKFEAYYMIENNEISWSHNKSIGFMSGNPSNKDMREIRIKNNIWEYVELKQQFITVPNSEVKFLKPDFEIELIKELFIGIVARLVFEQEDDSYVLYSNNGKILKSLDDNGYSSNLNLTPYEKPLPWYEDENNFPKAIIVDGRIEVVHKYEKDRKVLINYIHDSEIEIDGDFRLATKEEVNSLHYQGKEESKEYVECTICRKPIECKPDIKERLIRERVMCSECADKQFKNNPELRN